MKTDKHQKRLERYPDDGMVAGVAAGFAEYFNTDVTIMRLIFIAIAFATSGFAIFAYIILVIAMPAASSTGEEPARSKKLKAANTDKLRRYSGIVILVLGLWLLASQLFSSLWSLFEWSLFWPALLVVIGVLIIVRSRK